MRYSLKFMIADLMRQHGYDFKEAEREKVINMQREINSQKNRTINFEIQGYPDGSWVAKSTNVEGILTGSRNQSEVNELIKDAIFTYYDIPPQYANDRLLRNSAEPIMTKQHVRVAA